ncbi:hypothetical protein GEMRC1_000834 [Eukaryota sp. GEM-RC1]
MCLNVLFLDISQAQIAIHYGVSQSTTSKWISKAFDAASCPQSSDDKSRGKLSDEDIKYIIEILESDPLLYLREIVDLLGTNRNIIVSITTVHRALVREGYTHVRCRMLVKRAKSDPILSFERLLSQKLV